MCYLPNGTIVVSTRYLERFQSDAGLAAFIGHEVGHGVARHCLEHFTIVAILQPLISIPYLETPLGLVFSFISRRREMEADYIGLMLMASARYDP
ncbi:mitochondrial metalloendopeptidase OMA1-like [Rhododendron vialii]|uniref:mitochondrial metalloendopeptidase OMA1-like n=1 Tax=Rhododendron vialii TaxID=182163 RepID=UPI00265E6625|nr:mitochondrial metalloendopeptidase OMA1-like [Rhododendron vialii]